MQAFEAAVEALLQIVDYCPEAWLDALQGPMLGLGAQAEAAAGAGA